MKNITLLLITTSLLLARTIAGNPSEFSQKLADQLVQSSKEQLQFLEKTDEIIKKRVETGKKDVGQWLEIEKTAAFIAQNAEDMVQHAEKRIQELVKIK